MTKQSQAKRDEEEKREITEHTYGCAVAVEVAPNSCIRALRVCCALNSDVGVKPVYPGRLPELRTNQPIRIDTRRRIRNHDQERRN